MEDRDAARLLAWARVGLGVAGFLMPSTFARLWTGRSQPDFPTNMITRGFAMRDLAIGAGTLAAVEGEGSPRRWLQASAACDAADALGTLTSFRDLGGLRATAALVVEVGAAVVGFSLAERLD